MPGFTQSCQKHVRIKIFSLANGIAKFGSLGKLDIHMHTNKDQVPEQSEFRINQRSQTKLWIWTFEMTRGIAGNSSVYRDKQWLSEQVVASPYIWLIPSYACGKNIRN